MRVLVLGATGSVGLQAISVIKKLKYELCGISYHKNLKIANEIIKKHKLKFHFSSAFKSNINSYDELIKKSKPDIVINAVVGFAGLKATISTIENKIDLALANKESLVVAGKFVLEKAKANNVNIYPVDSEHAAIYEACHLRINDLSKILITASGGPFFNYSKKQLEGVTYQQAIKHPKWNMGAKISIDSATLMNKCFEIIEAYWLFNTKNIEPICHQQAIVHSMVQFKDGSINAIMSNPNMELPIAQALSKFKLNKNIVQPIDFKDLTLTFKAIDENKFKPISFAKEAIKNIDNSYSIILNAANETAIEMFENKQIKFNEIIKVIEFAIKNIKLTKVKALEQVFKIDKLTRETIKGKWE